MTTAYEGVEKLLTMLVGMNSVRIGLYTNSTEPDLSTDYASIVEPTFPGYANDGTVWDAVALNGDDDAETNLTLPKVFTQSGDATAELVYGAFLYWFDGVNAFFLDWLHFPTPLSFSTTGDNVTITNWRWRLGQLDV